MVKRVWFLKVKQPTVDGYSEQCSAHGYEAMFIPTLDHRTESLPIIRALLEAGPTREALCGLIITSQRSVETLTEALASASMETECLAAWQSLPVYVVGEKTAGKLRQLPCFDGDAPWIVAHKATDLSERMLGLERLKRGDTLLFLAGDKRRDELPHTLANAGLTLREIQSYATCIHPLLDQRLRETQFTENDWVVYFSPSGVDYVQSVNKGHIAGQHAKIAAIGPTTASRLADLGRPPDVVSDKPDASHLVAALAAFDNRHQPSM